LLPFFHHTPPTALPPPWYYGERPSAIMPCQFAPCLPASLFSPYFIIVVIIERHNSFRHGRQHITVIFTLSRVRSLAYYSPECLRHTCCHCMTMSSGYRSELVIFAASYCLFTASYLSLWWHIYCYCFLFPPVLLLLRGLCPCCHTPFTGAITPYAILLYLLMLTLRLHYVMPPYVMPLFIIAYATRLSLFRRHYERRLLFISPQTLRLCSSYLSPLPPMAMPRWWYMLLILRYLPMPFLFFIIIAADIRCYRRHAAFTMMSTLLLLRYRRFICHYYATRMMAFHIIMPRWLPSSSAHVTLLLDAWY